MAGIDRRRIIGSFTVTQLYKARRATSRPASQGRAPLAVSWAAAPERERPWMAVAARTRTARRRLRARHGARALLAVI
jgi:hypothetical protein